MPETGVATISSAEKLSFDLFREQVLNDYRIACISRETSLLGRKEVLTGKAKFGIFGDGKEVAQAAMARFFKPGDYRSGYYRDQTFAFAIGLTNVEQYFSQLYSDPDINNDPFSAGRQMNAHFATPNTKENGEWKVAFDKASIMEMATDKMKEKGVSPDSLYKSMDELKNINIDSLKEGIDKGIQALDSAKQLLESIKK